MSIVNIKHLISNRSEWIQLDLSSGSHLSNLVLSNNTTDFMTYLFNDVLNGAVGFGGYLEKRSIYNRSELFYDPIHRQYRNIHLGIDIWDLAGTEIICPIDAQIHSYAYNGGQLDYGNTIILESKMKSRSIYYLFGHLSNSSLTNIAGKSTVRKDSVVGWIGSPEENGGWPPHLHFQCIYDLGGCQGDYPGTCCEAELNYYRDNCPNPEDILGTIK